MKHNNSHYFIIAGEASGDLHGAELITHLKKIDSSSVFSGIGGQKMQQTGLNSLVPLEKLAVMGFWEVLKKYRFFLNLEKQVLQAIQTFKPSSIILIDYPGFNLRISKKIKQFSEVPIFYYISPQVWAWKEKRIIKIKKYIDSLIVIFPFEVSWFKKRNINVQYFGHPLIDSWNKQPILKTKKNKNIITIGLFPGSRNQEIQKHMPIFENLISKNNIKHKVKFIISKAPTISEKHFLFFKKKNVPILTCSLFQAFKQCDIAIVASGTATLECAISQTPFIVVYKMSFISWLITKYFINIQFASIVNILNKKKIVPELLQYQFSLNNLTKEINKLLIKDNYNNMQKNLKNVTSHLGAGVAYKAAANFILNYEKN